MSQYTDTALDTLKKKGFRITRPRRLVVELLDRTDKALSAYEIKDELDKSKESADVVSIYRILDCLEENGLIHRVLNTGKVSKCHLDHEDHCELEQSEHCHHLLICKQCGTIEEIHCEGVEDLIRGVAQKSDFTITEHRLEFSGICKGCRRSS